MIVQHETAGSWLAAIQSIRHHDPCDLLLIVDDDELTRKAMCRLMERVEVSVIPVGTLNEAISALIEAPAVVVIDLGLPDGDGLELLRAIRKAKVRCRVAIVSGYMDRSRFRQVSAARPDAIFSKPLDFEDFVDWLCEAFPDNWSTENDSLNLL